MAVTHDGLVLWLCTHSTATQSFFNLRHVPWTVEAWLGPKLEAALLQLTVDFDGGATLCAGDGAPHAALTPVLIVS